MFFRSQREVLAPLCALAFVLPAASTFAQNTGTTIPPVIDVHVHAMDESFPGGPACPNQAKFLASDPATKEATNGWSQEECTPKLYPAAKGEYIKDVVAEMERMNVTAVVFGDPASVQKWKDAAPGRVIPGTSFTSGMGGDQRVPLDQLRKDFTPAPNGAGFKVMGEIGLQYEGLSPSDPSVDQYFALAEELDIPVAIHMGTGGSGRANVAMPKFRGSMGNPLLLEELLARNQQARGCYRTAVPDEIGEVEIIMRQFARHALKGVAAIAVQAHYDPRVLNDVVRVPQLRTDRADLRALGIFQHGGQPFGGDNRYVVIQE